MSKFIFRWIVQMIAVWAATKIVSGISYDDWQSLLIAALVLGILNSLVKPVLQVLSIPFIIMTLGLFLIVINAILLRITSGLVHGFHVTGFWPAVGGSLVISVVSMFLGYPRAKRRIVVDRQEPPDDLTTNGPPPGKGPIIDV